MQLRYFFSCLILLGLSSGFLFASEKNSFPEFQEINEAEIAVEDKCLLRKPSAFAQKAESIVNINGTQVGEGIYLSCNRMRMSGLLNLDAKYANHTPLSVIPGFLNPGKKDFYINNANALFDLNVTQSVHAHVGIAYLDENYNKFFTQYTRYVNRGLATFSNKWGLDEFYISLRDFDRSPFFLKGGRYFLPFGDQNQEPYPLVRSLPQLLTQVRDTALEGGAVANNGIYSSLLISHRTDDTQNIYQYHKSRVNNFVSRLGATNTRGEMNFNINSSFIWDVRSVQLIEDQYNPYFAVSNFKRASAVSGHADVTFGQVILAGDIVATTKPLIPWNKATRPIAYNITAGYFFNLFGYDSVFHLSYQGTRHASDIFLNPRVNFENFYFPNELTTALSLPAFPKWRFKADYGFAVTQHASISVEYVYDRPYQDNFKLQTNGTHTIAARLSLSV